MKKISKINRELYQNSDKGKDAIKAFKKLSEPECSFDEMVNILARFNPDFFSNTSKKEMDEYVATLQDIDEILSDNIPEEFANEDELWNFYSWILVGWIIDGRSKEFEEIPQSQFKFLLQDNLFLSTILYAYLPEYFIPNLFVLQFIYLKKFAEKYEIELPAIPKRANYRDRCMYYIELCKLFKQFSVENEFESPAALCAYIYDYELPLIKEEMESEYNNNVPSIPEQAWILTGNYGDGEKNMDHGLWQANQLTRKGDILVFYEKSPVKKLNSVWIALEDGVVDPFFHYYSYTIIGKKITIPDNNAITFEEFKNSDYFKVENHGSEGNFVSKNFQDVSGWPVTSKDYAEIKRMLKAKGFDTSVLPSLYEPKKLAGVEIEHEADVSNKLLVPLLEEMGWKRDKDFQAEVEFPAGRGTTGHKMEKRPDFCLHLTGKDNVDRGAKVVIEVKLNMKNVEEIDSNYRQGVSYAKWGEAQVLVLCDKNQIRVYERNKSGKFDENKWKRFRWEEMEKLEKFNELKRMLDI